MKRFEAFRIYYNNSIHPELLRLENQRKGFINLMILSILYLFLLFAIQIYSGLFLFTMLASIPLGILLTFLFYRIRQFRIKFKPNVVKLILDFIDDGLNFGTLYYDANGRIPKEKFQASLFFKLDRFQYKGEDLIYGKIGELDFKMCELRVKEPSRVRNAWEEIFQGVFLHTQFPTQLNGEIIVWPRKLKQHLTRSIKRFISRRGQNVDNYIYNESFRELFTTYATPGIPLENVLNPEIQEAMVDFHLKTDKELFISFVQNEIYIGVTEPKDILEPYIFSSNVSFDLVNEFFEDIHILLSIIQEIDNNN